MALQWAQQQQPHSLCVHGAVQQQASYLAGFRGTGWTSSASVKKPQYHRYKTMCGKVDNMQVDCLLTFNSVHVSTLSLSLNPLRFE
jgi:hypothetical protein